MSNSSRPHGPKPTRLLRPWDFPGMSTGVVCHCLLRTGYTPIQNKKFTVGGKKKKTFTWKSQTKETEVGTLFTPKSTYDIDNFNIFKSTAKMLLIILNLVKEYNRFQLKSLLDNKINQ